MAPTTRPTLDELRERLAEFEEAYRQCSQIDSWPAVQRCQQQNRVHIDAIKAEIRQREAKGER
jgi:hypothetical protein